MNVMKNLIFVLVLFIVASCANESNSNAAQVAYEIEGTFSNHTGSFPIYLDKLSYSGSQTIDTAIVSADGNFKMKGTVPQAGLYMLRVSQDRSWVMIVDKEKVKFTADYNDIFNYSLSSAPNKVLSGFVNNIGKERSGLQEYQNTFMQAQMMGDAVSMENAQNLYNEAVLKYNAAIQAMADTTKFPLVGLFAITMLNMEQNAVYVEQYAQKIKKELPDNELAKEFVARVESETKIAVGKAAPNFQLKNMKGETVSLDDAKGKVILLDFWASWCRPCRMENPNVVRLYDQYKEKGFTVFSVSLDNNLQKWVGAIEQDKLSWSHHGSNLLGWQCPVAQQYKVSSIPQTYLIDKNGIIIGKNLRGIDLENKLTEIFK
jgi:peroxiredoxin